MALTDLTRISTSGIATGSTIDSPILRKDVSLRGSHVGVTSALFDSSDNALEFNDNVKLKFGNGGDLEVYHSGSGSYITDSGAGSLYVQGTNLYLTDEDGTNMLYAANNAGVNLYHGGGIKFNTTSTGAVVTGILTATSFSGDLSGNATSATTTERVTLTNQGGDSSCNVLFAQSATGNQLPHTNANLIFNATNGTLTATTFSGALSGNATSADTIDVTNDSSANTTFYLTFVDNAGSGKTLSLDTGLTYVPSSNILTAGTFSGSGASLTNVNADTLDGIQGASFLRSDTTDTFTGNELTLSSSSNQKLILQGATDPYIRFKEGTTNKAYIQWNSAGYIEIRNQEDDSTLYIKDGLCFSQSVGGTQHTIWHSGNDGTGSGLDADTLDGVQGSSFLRSDATDTASGAITFTSHTLHLSGHYYQKFYSGTQNYIHLYPNGHTGNASTTDIRAHNGVNGADVFKITGGSSTGLKWRGHTIWTAENDGSGSGLDADTLDGIEGASFVRSDASDTLTGGTYTFNSSTSQKIILSGANNPYIRFQEGTTDKAYIQFHTNGSFYFVNQETGEHLRIGSGGNGLQYHHDGNDRTVWHSGNDGSGSGLDADTLDGIEGASFVRSDTGDTLTGGTYILSSTTDQKLILQGSSSPYIRLREGTTDKAYWQFNSDGNVYFWNQESNRGLRLGTDINYYNGSYQTIWHSGNDGAGSGLDADVLDGIASTSFLRSDADDNCGARITFQNNLNDNDDDMATSTAYLGGLEVQNTGVGNDAFMAFHAGGDYALYFGLDADTNRLAVGGWSMGAVKYSLLHTNFVSVRGSSAGQGYDIRLSMDGTRAAASVGHNATQHEGIFWHTSSNYGIYRTAGNWSGNYSQLRLDWPTGIVIDGGDQYGLSHVRFECNVLPNATNTRDLGSSSLRWRNLYTNDLNLSNEGGTNDVDGTWGSYTIQEGEDDLFLINKRNGKKYKFNLTEVS